LPEALFRRVAAIVAERLGEPAELSADCRCSGPPEGEPDPFTTARADFGFLCAPSYLRLGDSVRLVGACPVFADPRLAGRAAYFSDVIARRDRDVVLGHARWGYNDLYSQSGYFNVRDWLQGSDREHFVATARCSGSHLASIDGIVRGELDVAAIDSNVLWLRLRSEPELAERIRVIASIGPLAVQPIVARASLPLDVVRAARDALLGATGLERFGVVRFAPVDHEDYSASSAELLRAAG
jgi:ABC-type phosphate/phosphonate transport system substrate-binding protein